MSEALNHDRTDAVVETEFRLRDPAYPFVGVSESEACTFRLAEMVPRHAGRYAEFFNVTGTDPEVILELAAEHGAADVSLINEYEDGGLFEFLVSGNCPARVLAELGALPRRVESEHGEGRIVAEIPSRYDSTTIIERFLEEVPESELGAVREKDSFTPLLSHAALSRVLHTHLTDRQREVIRAAFEAGYYEWPRECTGEKVADSLGISSATFAQHIHAAERKLLAQMFEASR